MSDPDWNRQGLGDTFSTMLLSILNLCGLRILWLTIMIPFFPSIYTLYLGYPVTWGTAAVCMGIYYCKKSNRAFSVSVRLTVRGNHSPLKSHSIL